MLQEIKNKMDLPSFTITVENTTDKEVIRDISSFDNLYIRLNPMAKDRYPFGPYIDEKLYLQKGIKVDYPDNYPEDYKGFIEKAENKDFYLLIELQIIEGNIKQITGIYFLKDIYPSCFSIRPMHYHYGEKPGIMQNRFSSLKISGIDSISFETIYPKTKFSMIFTL